MKQKPGEQYVLLIYFFLALATFVAFGQVLRNEFVDLDDGIYVAQNPHVSDGLTRESVVWAFAASHAANWHPLTWLSHMLDCQLFGLDPSRHHLMNLLLHIANTLLLFWVLKRMTRALWQSAFVAALFALHPLHVESVAWVSERKDVLSTLFWLLTMGAYVRYAESGRPGRYVLVLLFFALGLLAKPMLVTLPFVLLLLDYWPLRRLRLISPGITENQQLSESNRSDSHCFSARRLIVEKIPLFILAAVSCVITFAVQHEWAAVSPMPFKWRLVNALTSYLVYIEKMIWPSRLAVFYPHRLSGILLWELAAAAILLPLISVRVIRSARHQGFLLTGWFWFLGTLVPVIGLVQVGDQAIADRYTYVPSIGLFIMLAWGIGEFSVRWSYRKIVLCISTGLILAGMLIATKVQVRHWQNDFTLFSHALEVTRDNSKMHNRYGVALLNAGQFDEALLHFNEAVRITPLFLEARTNVVMAYLAQGKFDEATAYLDEALRIKQDWPEGYHNLGTLYARQGKYELAVQNYSEALRLKPDYVDAHSNLAMALLLQGRIDEAIDHCRQALQIDPEDKRALQALKAASAKRDKADKQSGQN